MSSYIDAKKSLIEKIVFFFNFIFINTICFIKETVRKSKSSIEKLQRINCNWIVNNYIRLMY